MLTFGYPLSTKPELLMRRTSGQAYVPNAGVRWRVSPRVAIAAAYNGGGTFDRTEDHCVVELSNATCTSQHATTAGATVERPDAYRASIAIVPVERLTVTAQAVRNNYSKQLSVVQEYGPPLADYTSGDATDLHVGAEYRLRNLPVSLRAGWWRDDARRFDDAYALPNSVDHRTIGAGIEFGAARFDVSYDDAPESRRAIAGVTWTR
jgi:hypothetical protein